MSIEIVAFEDRFIAEAARLLALRHQRNRVASPELPRRFEDPGVARVALEAAWRRPSASGAVALDRGRLVGYLFGDTIADSLMGRTAWVRLAGHALEQADQAELYRDLYAASGPAWLAQGCFDHYVLAPASDRPALGAWFALSFGQQQAFGLCSLDQVQDGGPGGDQGFEIRLASWQDRQAFVEMADITLKYQTRAPVWAATPPEKLPLVREGYAEILDDESVRVWLALREGKVIGFQAYFPAEAAGDDLLRPEACIELKIGATREEERGRGIGRALTQHGFADARERGYKFCLADWRVTNLSSSRFWPRQGFRPVVYRLVRRVDSRIAWAHW